MSQAQEPAQIGIYGLGTMGSALALNLAEQGIRVAITNRDSDWIAPFLDRAGALAGQMVPADTLAEFVAALASPRIVLFMIPSGAPMDAMLAEIVPLLAPGDIVIDAGNADFNDTRRRTRELAPTGLHFTGMGVSGGEAGARHGPSIMVGGSKSAWTALEPILTRIAARYEGTPCVARVGPDGAGHFVKTVHNGIEYADMQMIAEIYGLLRDGAGWEAPRIGALFADWDRGPLHGFLTEVTAKTLVARDPATGRPLVDAICDRAGQKGTGRWTVIEALKLGQAAGVIGAAVDARVWSAQAGLRQCAEERLSPGAGSFDPLPAGALEQALIAGRLVTLVQGFEELAAASGEFSWELDLAGIARIWRAGCIIRSDLLHPLIGALGQAGPLPLAHPLPALLAANVAPLRRVVAGAVGAGLPVPALAAALGWYDSIRRARGSANLIQAQRDFFGAHGFARIDSPGSHHGDWGER
ncbi:NADP-dependent phosphogluconate dehydrogenase [Pontibaca methylaminivorans]|uniref:6-phosphogluconate dehydrogenase, decarboxylating n=1 Tax=Pontibaca methylaminivorans TaxID=515897 RepID=A0A1R3X8D7_9RHOB|nr:NADP-dependent phosphogluconate dehydrogenase [Pontibaca methylaminivorans]SIT86974.1 6-phosphogluconate dehydrogenase [Pontibaca methylaminivorans]